MTLKYLLIGGLFGLTLMGATQAAPYQTPVSDENTMKVAYWCDSFGRCHKHKKRHHHRHGFYKQPYSAYHPYARGRASYCWNHPYSSPSCERFCAINGCRR